ncbi:MAG: ribosome silencing factor [Bacteroidota bacterium]
MAKSIIKKVSEEKKTTSAKQKKENPKTVATKEILKPSAKAKEAVKPASKAKKTEKTAETEKIKPLAKTPKTVTKKVKVEVKTKTTKASVLSVKTNKEAKKAPVKKKAENIEESQLLARTIVSAMHEKKAKDVVVMDLRKIGSRICDFFVICHAASNTQVDAIAHSVEDYVRKNIGQKPWHIEGFENAEWVLVDYVDVVAHVFQEEKREFYNIEELWADAEIKKFENVE